MGGSVTGLQAGASLVLQDNGGNNLTVNKNGVFAFHQRLAAGANYSVTIATQPDSERCSVQDGTGVLGTADITSVAVTCLSNVWTWIGGSDLTDASGVYGTLNVDSALDIPGARSGANAWTHSPAKLWLFGGTGYDATGQLGSLNDLWTYCSCSGIETWTWVSGSAQTNVNGTYGTLGIASAQTLPGGRSNASTWTDSYGNLWLFGGAGYASQGSLGDLNDLWKYTPSLGTWAWIGGSNLVGAEGVYGTKNVAAVGNVPGARASAESWTDAAGNLWLFGGSGVDSTGASGELNDLWRFSTSDGTWTWISGSALVNATGNYGALGLGTSTTAPGARQGGTAWTDPQGDFWLFGGLGYDLPGTKGELNDLWEFNPTSGLWTWIGGSDEADGAAVYGVLGVASSQNIPGPRQGGNSWTDLSGNLWLFGGVGYDAIGAQGDLNDLWRFNPGAGTWEWIAGANLSDAPGVYGPLGVVSADTGPGARTTAYNWIDTFGNLWLFGGYGYARTGPASLNDLWEYTP
jgi:N-acetylneuraminic acid mutarotase